ncbi:UNVERIFIED_CONTAM: hypothetical protein NCL1_26663 [Trichonephila clavipes]
MMDVRKLVHLATHTHLEKTDGKSHQTCAGCRRSGYEETITITKPPLTFPEKPPSDKTGFVISLYQVLPGEDGLRFEQNWVMWTGARQLYRNAPDYLGLKRISVHKSVLPTKVINYCLLCEFSNILDHLTDACVVIDHLRARCCGFTGIYRILDSL